MNGFERECFCDIASLRMLLRHFAARDRCRPVTPSLSLPKTGQANRNHRNRRKVISRARNKWNLDAPSVTADPSLTEWKSGAIAAQGLNNETLSRAAVHRLDHCTAEPRQRPANTTTCSPSSRHSHC